jgi:Flp pilus assembly pilin Flp
MRSMLLKLWRDDAGALIATEWVFVVTILVIGLVVGLKTVQQAVLNELEEVATAIGAISQTYSYGGASGCCSFVNGSAYIDEVNTWPIATCTAGLDGNPVSCEN